MAAPVASGLLQATALANLVLETQKSPKLGRRGASLHHHAQ